MRRVSVLARKLLFADGIRVIVAGMAIILVSLLFMTVLSISASLMQAEVLIKQLATGSDFHGMIKELSLEEAQAAASHAQVKKSYILSERGEVYSKQETVPQGLTGENGTADGHPLLMACEDETLLAHLFLKIEEGRYPEKENEILLSRSWLEAQGLPTKTGTELSLWVDNEPQLFLLSGTFVSLADETANESAFTRGLGESCTVYFEFYNSVAIEGKMAQLAQAIGLFPNDSRISVNDAFTFARTQSVSAGALFLFLLAVAFVFASGFLVIYSIYTIALRKDLRAYGLLKTLGMTGKQLRQLVFIQINLIGGFFIPVGTGLGYFVGWRLLTPLFMSLSGKDLTFAFQFNPYLLLFTLVFTYGTAVVSAQAPVRRIAKMSCIETLLEGESPYRPKSDKRSLNGGKAWRMALSNVLRERGKTLATIFSVGLSVVLFLFVVNLTRLVFNTDRIQAADYRVLMKLPEMGKRDTLYSGGSYLEPAMLEELASLGGLSAGQKAIPVYGAYLKAYLPGDSRKREVLVLGISEDMVPYLARNAVSEGRFDRSAFFKGGYVLVSGDVQSTVRSSATPSPLPLKTGQVLSLDAFGRDFTLMGIAEGHHRFINRLIQLPYYGSEEVVFFMSEGELRERYKGGGLMAINVFSSPESSEELTALMSRYEDKGFSVESREDQWRELTARLNALRIVGYSLWGIVLLVGVINFINTTVCGVFSRRRELALLEIVGMTRRHIKKMLLLESLCHVFFASLFGLVAGYPFIRLIFAAGEIRQEVNLWPVGVMLAFLTLVSFLCTLTASHILDRGTPVEHLCESV